MQKKRFYVPTLNKSLSPKHPSRKQSPQVKQGELLVSQPTQVTTKPKRVEEATTSAVSYTAIAGHLYTANKQVNFSPCI